MAKDPYRYFRIEACELCDGIAQGVLELEKGGGAATVGRLLRLAHTLKGASRVVKLTELAEHAHAIEEVLSPFRRQEDVVPRAAVDELLRRVDAISAALKMLEPGLPPPVPVPAPETPATPAPNVEPPLAAAPRASDEALQTVRVELSEMEALLSDIAEAGVQLSALRRLSAAVEAAEQSAVTLSEQLTPRRSGLQPLSSAASLARARELTESLRRALDQVKNQLAGGLDRASVAIDEVRERGSRIRLLPAATLFAPLERAVRDAAQALGRRVELATDGGTIRLDGHVLLAMRDALLHVVRNAVAHGIEPEPERLRSSKPAVGRIDLRVERRGHRVSFVCSDDGRGIDVAAVKQAALERGLASAADLAAMDQHGAMQLVFLPGMSTAREVTEISGRGVGLDVVRATALAFKGDFAIRSEAGRGTAIEISVPVSLSSMTALLVEAGEHSYSIPLDAVSRSLRVASEEIVVTGSSCAILQAGEAIPFVPLPTALGSDGAGAEAGARRTWPTILLRAGGRNAAIGVDRMLGTEHIVVKPLPERVGRLPLVAGASLDANGDPHLVLDPVGLVEAACAARAAAVAPTASKRPPPILVIDDSLTTRMLEQSILESVGYEVDVAVSAEDALQKAAHRAYGLFVCDVEMPGMSGFEFVAHTRADATFSSIPVIMVTSLSSPDDRQRAVEAGASAYIVKSEFDQVRLLELIREVMC